MIHSIKSVTIGGVTHELQPESSVEIPVDPPAPMWAAFVGYSLAEVFLAVSTAPRPKQSSGWNISHPIHFVTQRLWRWA